MSTEKRIAVVTGANRGLGLEVSKQLAQHGFQVWMIGRNKEQIESAAKSIAIDPSLDVVPFHADITLQSDVEKLIKSLASSELRVHCLVNNAGVLLDFPNEQWDDTPNVLTVTQDILHRTLEVNSLAPIRMIQAIAPFMVKNRLGTIVNVSSEAGSLSHSGQGAFAYRLSKTALNALTVTAANELKDDGILVNAVCPGWVKTAMGGPFATTSVEEGANGVVWAALLSSDGPTGSFFHHKRPIPW